MISWSVLATGISAGETSNYDFSNGFELAGSKTKKRRLRSGLSSKENLPQVAAASYSSTLQSSPSDGVAVKPINSAPGSKPTLRPDKTRCVGKGTEVGLSATGDMSTLAAARQFKALHCVENVDQSVDANELAQFVSRLGV